MIRDCSRVMKPSAAPQVSVKGLGLHPKGSTHGREL